MKKEISAFMAVMLALSAFTGCSEKEQTNNSPSAYENSDSYVQMTEPHSENNSAVPEKLQETVTEAPTEAPTDPPHISPIENVSAKLGTQQTIDRVIERTEGSNTIQLPLSDFIEEGDIIESFTFIVYSTDGSNIGTYKGGCGISVSEDCPLATNDCWYQSDDFSAETQGSYGEITWNVPEGIREYINEGGDVLFGYWWGNVTNIRIDTIICTFSRSRDVSVDGTVHYDVNKSVNYSDTDNIIKIAQSEFLPENSVLETVTYNISSAGSLGKFTGAFGYESKEGYYQSIDTAVFSENPTLSLTWFIPDSAKDYISENGEIFLGYWWSNQPTVTIDSIDVKYSFSSEKKTTSEPQTTQPTESEENTGFRSSAEIVKAIEVGWNLGNSLESYDTEKSGLDTETGWGNPKTTRTIIQSVKNAGFNAIRIPVTWNEHLDGDKIQPEWLYRVQEIVDYAYNENMFVIINVHHDDYLWLNPDESQYQETSKKLCSLWEQIAERFKNYNDRLLFEGMNEVRTIGSTEEWTGGTPEERNVINKLEADFVKTVRATGGNNAERTLIVTSYAASAEENALKDIVIPDDSHIILSLHYYAPWDFSQGTTTKFDKPKKKQLSTKFSYIKSEFVDKGIPVIIGEFGCIAAASDDVRASYFNSYINLAKECGIKCFVWDNGISKGSDSYGIFNRKSLIWNNTILKGIINGTK